MKRYGLPALLLALLSTGAMASDWETDLSFNLGLTAGLEDDKINGGSVYREKTGQYLGDTHTRAGGLYYTGLGLQFANADWGVLANAAYHFDAAWGRLSDDDGAEFRRFTYDLLPYYRIDRTFRVGAGATYHASPKSSISDDGVKASAKYDDALGVTVFAGYQLPESRSWVELRYTDIDYEAETTGMNDLDGAHFGLILHWIPDMSTASEMYRESMH